MTRRQLLVCLAAAVALNLVVGLSLAEEVAAASARSAGVTIRVPAGWSTSVLPVPGGVLVADSQADLFAANVNGGRLTVQPSASLPSPQSLVSGVNRSPLYNPVVAPEDVGRFKNVPVVRFQTAKTTNNGETVEVLALTVARGKAYLFTLEAPSAGWRSAKPVLEAMVVTARFNLAAFPS
jgi:hypothetical protein